MFDILALDVFTYFVYSLAFPGLVTLPILHIEKLHCCCNITC